MRKFCSLFDEAAGRHRAEYVAENVGISRSLQFDQELVVRQVPQVCWSLRGRTVSRSCIKRPLRHMVSKCRYPCFKGSVVNILQACHTSLTQPAVVGTAPLAVVAVVTPDGLAAHT